MLGDLNATAGDPAVAHLVAGGLRDTLAHLGARGPQAATHHPWDGSTDGTRIDYVLVDDGWDVLDARIDHARPGGRLPSDHWPVVAEVALRPAGRGTERRQATRICSTLLISPSFATLSLRPGRRRIRTPQERGPGASRKDGDAS